MLIVLLSMMTKRLVGADLKVKLKRGSLADVQRRKIRDSLYRPFTKSNLYFDRVMNDIVAILPNLPHTGY